MRVLVTNDDGIDAPGLHALAIALDADGHDVLVVAPGSDHSGYGAAIGDLGRQSDLHTTPATIPGAEHITAFSLAGPPALCVMAARLGGFGDPPELVASGINPGNNTGRAVLHSGTIGAALTGANLGISGLAVSVGVDREGTAGFGAAAEVAAASVGWLVTAPPKTVLNVNVPPGPLAAVRGSRWASLAPFGTVRAALRQGGDDGVLELTLVESGVELPPDSDTALVTAGYVAVTCITSIRADDWQPAAAEIDRRLAARATAPRRPAPSASTRVASDVGETA
ncbi:5'/3'-nucleotidase SurE [Iamia sp. SCSIO 61187]|uniref:5'/3'-nucleotidase SurE n=1 Tax=Iamia sp. SCSIO 61187 TaxID=2722752 RepID=UPI001C62C2D4|nr:5'/3'-nucleotidase SurE [Iamia sp. SCSIO 61187]QYG91365.1 5'/3'-nucleotidase SurE [Iamia sp. SCSIO 61187]